MKKWLIVIAAVVVIAAWQLSLLYEDVFAEHLNAEQQAAEKAKQAFQLKSVSSVSFFHGDDACFVVKGKTADGNTLFVWVPKKEGELIERKAEGGWSRQKVETYIRDNYEVKEMIDIHPGLVNDVPIWEIVYRDKNGTYVIHQLTFQNGEKVVIYGL